MAKKDKLIYDVEEKPKLTFSWGDLKDPPCSKYCIKNKPDQTIN